MNLFFFNLCSKMIKHPFLIFKLNSFDCICYKIKLFTKSIKHSFISYFQILVFTVFIKQNFMSFIFSIKTRMSSIAKCIKFLDYCWDFSSHRSKNNFKISIFLSQPKQSFIKWRKNKPITILKCIYRVFRHSWKFRLVHDWLSDWFWKLHWLECFLINLSKFISRRILVKEKV